MHEISLCYYTSCTIPVTTNQLIKLIKMTDIFHKLFFLLFTIRFTTFFHLKILCMQNNQSINLNFFIEKYIWSWNVNFAETDIREIIKGDKKRRWVWLKVFGLLSVGNSRNRKFFGTKTVGWNDQGSKTLQSRHFAANIRSWRSFKNCLPVNTQLILSQDLPSRVKTAWDLH